MTEPCHVATERCHAMTERCHSMTERCHAMTGRCHAMTGRCHAVTEHCHAMAGRCYAATERCYATTVRCHARTEHCHAATERCHAVTERCHVGGCADADIGVPTMAVFTGLSFIVCGLCCRQRHLRAWILGNWQRARPTSSFSISKGFLDSITAMESNLHADSHTNCRIED
jgi:hypothetical protein